MSSRSNRTSGFRAITAVIALYAFVLQVFFAGLMPTTIGVDGHVRCLSGTMAVGDPAPEPPAHSHADCCTAAQAAATALAPRESTATGLWPSRRAETFAFAAEATNGPRAPPGSIAHPRGPPAL